MTPEQWRMRPVERVSRDRPLPASFAQQRLWFIQQLEPDNIAYNSSRVIRITGSLDASILERCFEALVERHEPLRTTFLAKSGAPFQCINSHAPSFFRQRDLRSFPVQGREEEAARRIGEELRTRFDLAA